MEQFHDALGMLDLMSQPAFCVRDEKIIKVNPTAAAFLIEIGTPLQALLHTGAEEYALFQGGCLYLTLTIAGQHVGASVSRMQDFDVFCMELDGMDAHLQAMALAAKELREPLSGMMAIADKLFPETAAKDPGTNEQLSQMNRSLYQMLRIIGNMSDARYYAADSGMRQEIRDICAVLDEIFHRASELAAHTGVSLHFTGYPESIYTLVDSQKLERMVLNILSNTLKFTPAGGSIEAKLFRRGMKLYLSISDCGSGIQDAQRMNLFSRYLREPGVEDGRHGLGLGMVLIRSTAAIHGGTVLIDNPDHVGTRITVSFSIRQGDAVLRSPRLRFDYAGERDHALVELSDVLPAQLYDPTAVN